MADRLSSKIIGTLPRLGVSVSSNYTLLRHMAASPAGHSFSKQRRLALKVFILVTYSNFAEQYRYGVSILATVKTKR